MLLPTVTWKQPDRLAHYKRGCLPPPPSLTLLPLTFLLPLSPHSLLPSLYVVMAGLYFSTFSLYYPLNSPPHALNKLYSILYHLWLIPLGEGMPWYGPAEAPPSPIPGHTSIEHIPLLFIFV